MPHHEQIQRIKRKLREARSADRHCKVFGASSHRYVVNQPASEKEVISFEQEYSISLPECYRRFLLEIGNGGVSTRGSAAGPFYGIYPLAQGVKDLVAEPKRWLSQPVQIEPDMTDEAWDSLCDLDESESGPLFSGLLPIGTQGCSYLHAIVLNGIHRGRVVNVDEDLQKPRFTFETNFLDWYERWLDEVISGVLLADGPTWFGYAMGGTDEELLQVFQRAEDHKTRMNALAGLERLTSANDECCQMLRTLCSSDVPEIRHAALQLLTKFAYSLAVEPLGDHIARDDQECLIACKAILWHAKDKCRDWVGALRSRLPRISSQETFQQIGFILVEAKIDFSQDFAPFCTHSNEVIRASVYDSLGELPRKAALIHIFQTGLHDPSPLVVNAALQALEGVRDPILLVSYRDVLERFAADSRDIHRNLELRLKEMGYPSKYIFRMVPRDDLLRDFEQRRNEESRPPQHDQVGGKISKAITATWQRWFRQSKQLFCLALLAAVALGSALQAAAPAKPNILFILADDLGWADTTLYGRTKLYRTPNLERLAQRGMTFTRAYSASPLCSPTRSAILTGLNPARTGITAPDCHLPEVRLEAVPGKAAAPDKQCIPPVPPTRLKTDYPTLAKSLKAAGYATGHFGKWHLGAEPYSPLQQGFDVDLPHWPGPGPAGSYVAPWKFKNFDADPGEPRQHIEDRMAKEAVAWMAQHKDGPFFLNYWMFSVHAPFDAKQASIEKYRARVNPADPQRSPTYAAMVESMDDAVGTLLAALDRLGLAERTIIVFASDNGGNMYDTVDGTTPTSNAPLRGGKATVFEGGTRVPCVVVMPGITPAGSRSDALVQSEDFFPTLLEALALQPAPGQRFDGISLMPALKGGRLDRGPVFQYFPHSPPVPDWLPPAISVHRDDWKLIRIFHGGDQGAHRYLLYNLRDDLSETNNLASRKPALVAELDSLITRFLADTKAVLPLPNPKFDPAQYHPELEGQPKPKSSAPAKAAAKDDSDPALRGWKARNCTAAVHAGVLSVSNLKDTSFLGFSAANHAGPSTVKFHLKASAGRSRIDWLPGGVQGKAQSAPFTLAGGGWEEITVPLPATGPLGIVRIYLGRQDDPIQLDWIEITSENGAKTRTRF